MPTMLVGEAWGVEEEREGRPFVGASGRLLKGCLSQVGISYNECYVTNVLNLRPRPSNDIKNCCGRKDDGIPGWPAVVKGKYMLTKYANELDRLLTEVCNVQPTLIIALGGTASWALLKTSGIKGIRGAPMLAHIRGQSFKVLPTYHPAAILREWTNRPVLISDLFKAKRESGYPEIRRPKREIWVEPSLDDLTAFEQKYILPSPDLSVDIETTGDQIECVGFAPTIDRALVVPFFDKTRSDRNYWPTLEDEVNAWLWIRRICSLPKRIVGQNFLFDMHRLWRGYGITVPHMKDDTMLLHHALQPEMEKSLDFLGSTQTDEARWKFMRKKTSKKED